MSKVKQLARAKHLTIVMWMCNAKLLTQTLLKDRESYVVVHKKHAYYRLLIGQPNTDNNNFIYV